MKKALSILFLLVSFVAFGQIDKVIPAAPKPARLYNDLTKDKNFLTTAQATALEEKLVAYDDSTSNQVAIVIVDDLHGYDANQFATELGEKWGVGGQEKFDNGIVVLISTGGGDGNRDAYIATGRGLEGAIPDMTAASIVDNYLIPNFKSGNYYRGLDETADAIARAAAGEYKAPTNYKKSKKDFGGLGKAILLFIAIILIIIFGGGTTGGSYMSGGGYTGWTGGGSSGGGGGWSGGGGSSGGFGGFGGGSFGGGGAGGKW